MESKVQTKIIFGQNESAILRRLSEPDAPKLLTTSSAKDYVGRNVSSNSLTHTVTFLVEKGVLDRVGKGLYLNRSGNISPRITEVIPCVFKDVHYYVGLNAAANYWGLTPQIPNIYQVIYVPKDEATDKRMKRWSSMLNSRKQLGGELRPIRAKVSGIVDSGVTRKVIDETPLPTSTVEATLLDGAMYTEEIGGADEILNWMKVAFNMDLVRTDEFLQLTETFSGQIQSVNARVGFLLEYLSDVGAVTNATPIIARLVNHMHERLDRYPSYRWGKESTDSEYIRNWRLHISKTYLNQLDMAATFK